MCNIVVGCFSKHHSNSVCTNIDFICSVVAGAWLFYSVFTMLSKAEFVTANENKCYIRHCCKCEANKVPD